MPSNEPIILTRDCPAVLIPAGDPITLSKGETVYITQALGGNYTVVLNGNLVQIDGKDADAIGKKAIEIDKNEEPCDTTQPPDEQMIWHRLKTCYDPEIPVNIVDLGLIYDLTVEPLEGCGYQVNIKMTLTAPGCGMGDYIAADVKTKAETVTGVTKANVELVWEPLWNREMMSDAARLELGLF